jgi:multidrug/hemolysin transport system permease protein
MGIVLDIMGRNLRLFFRDRLNVFFSLLGALIVFLLYTLFLANLQTTSIANAFPQADESDVKGFVDSWMFGGIVAMTSITTSLGALGVFVEDAATGRFRDFLVSPIRRGQLVLGYLLSTFVVALIMTVLVLAVSLIYLFAVDGVVIAIPQILATLGWIALACLAFAALWAFVASFIRTTSAFSALATIVGTVIGFLAGAFIAVGLFPEAVRNVVNALPFAQTATLMRRELTGDTLSTLVGGQQEAIDALSEYYGITAFVGDWQVTVPVVAGILVACAVIFTALAAWRIRARLA